MTTKSSYKIIEFSKYSNFLRVSQNFLSGAELAFEFEYYNAAGILIIHSAIALADTITIKKASKKCNSTNHLDIIHLLNDVTPYDKNKNTAVENFKKLIEHKNIISYSGDIYSKNDVDKLFKYYKRFECWALHIINM